MIFPICPERIFSFFEIVSSAMPKTSMAIISTFLPRICLSPTISIPDGSPGGYSLTNSISGNFFSLKSRTTHFSNIHDILTLLQNP